VYVCESAELNHCTKRGERYRKEEEEFSYEYIK